MNSIQNSQTVQSIANGPVADKARAEAARHFTFRRMSLSKKACKLHSDRH
jgi:hypothetical protein